jgi:hypothetical protein
MRATLRRLRVDKAPRRHAPAVGEVSSPHQRGIVFRTVRHSLSGPQDLMAAAFVELVWPGFPQTQGRRPTPRPSGRQPAIHPSRVYTPGYIRAPTPVGATGRVAFRVGNRVGALDKAHSRFNGNRGDRPTNRADPVRDQRGGRRDRRNNSSRSSEVFSETDTRIHWPGRPVRLRPLIWRPNAGIAHMKRYRNIRDN